jgi:hypothetical protein
MVMTGMEILIPMAIGAVTNAGVTAARGGKFGDIAKSAGIGAAGGAAGGALGSGLSGLLTSQGTQTALNATTAPPTDGAIAPNLASQQVSVQNIPEAQPNLMATLNSQAQQAEPNIKPEPWQMPTTEQALAVEKQPSPQGKDWTTSDYINAASSASNVASNIANATRSNQQTMPIAPMPAIFSGQGGDLMQQLAQLSQV